MRPIWHVLGENPRVHHRDVLTLELLVVFAIGCTLGVVLHLAGA